MQCGINNTQYTSIYMAQYMTVVQKTLKYKTQMPELYTTNPARCENAVRETQRMGTHNKHNKHNKHRSICSGFSHSWFQPTPSVIFYLDPGLGALEARKVKHNKQLYLWG